MKNIVVLVSGGGTNLQALIDAQKSGVISSGSIELVISNKEGAFALERAASASIKNYTVIKKQLGSQEAFENKLIEIIDSAEIDIIVLAGFLSILSERFTSHYEKRILNVHPSLIPSFCGEGFYGLRVHEAALAKGVKVTGATVHYVNAIPDDGEIIMQKAVAVPEGSTPESLQKRVMRLAEWKILPLATEKVCKEIITITEPSSNAIEGKINKTSFQNSRFLRINQVTNNIRVLDKTTSVMNVIGVDMSDKQKLAAKYVVLRYFTNKETGMFNKFENSYLNPVANEKKGNSTVLILQKYHFALHEYLSRQYIADFPLIYTLIADGTFNLRQIDDLNKIIYAIVNLEKVELDKDFRAINNDESTTIKETISILNESATSFTSKVVVSNFTCDLLFIKNSFILYSINCSKSLLDI